MTHDPYDVQALSPVHEWRAAERERDQARAKLARLRGEVQSVIADYEPDEQHSLYAVGILRRLRTILGSEQAP